MAAASTGSSAVTPAQAGGDKGPREVKFKSTHTKGTRGHNTRSPATHAHLKKYKASHKNTLGYCEDKDKKKNRANGHDKKPKGGTRGDHTTRKSSNTVP